MSNNILTSKSPTIDLHGETRDFIPYLLDNFLNDNYKLHNKFLIIIHGWNSDILKKEVQSYLKGSKIVKNFYIDPYNIGQTIVELDV